MIDQWFPLSLVHGHRIPGQPHVVLILYIYIYIHTYMYIHVYTYIHHVYIIEGHNMCIPIHIILAHALPHRGVGEVQGPGQVAEVVVLEVRVLVIVSLCLCSFMSVVVVFSCLLNNRCAGISICCYIVGFICFNYDPGSRSSPAARSRRPSRPRARR